jgi:hypothetical protein
MFFIRTIQFICACIAAFGLFDGLMPGRVLPGYAAEVMFVGFTGLIVLMEAIGRHDHR